MTLVDDLAVAPGLAITAPTPKVQVVTMTELRFTTVNPDTPLLRDKQTGVISVPLLVHDDEGRPASGAELLLDGVRAELLHASLSRALNGQDPRGRVR